MLHHEGLQFRSNGNGKVKRKIVHIDETKCDGCGECIPSCAEGAIEIVDGKARLIADRLCDGMGACLGNCPLGAITVEERESEPFEEAAVIAQRVHQHAPSSPPSGCPSARILQFAPPARTPATRPDAPAQAAGALRHWPVQLHLVPPTAPFFKEADLLICAPCVPVAMPDFHQRLLNGRSVALACPKLDDQTGYVEKLALMFAHADLRSVTVARMLVPCCGGLLRLVRQARDLAGSELPITDIVIGHNGIITETNTETCASGEAPCHGVC
jgi:Pyruvate/2-oxoacid:ferredoxin oxidoreductase delta subunit